MDAIFAAPDGPTPNTEEASHLHLETDADGEPLLTRFTYADSNTQHWLLVLRVDCTEYLLHGGRSRQGRGCLISTAIARI